MSYATPSDVVALNRARKPGQGNNPSLADIQVYLDLTAADIDAVLLTKGYQPPIATQYAGAFGLLRSVNAKGALYLMEEASPNSTILDRAKDAWEKALEALEKSRQVMDAPVTADRSEPRAPGVTSVPDGQVFNPDRPFDRTVNNPVKPYFSKAQRF